MRSPLFNIYTIMPNWCSNTLTISGNVDDIKKMFNYRTIKKKFGKKELTEKSFVKYFEKADLKMSSWMPMPKTFIKWDTTNHMRTRDATDWKTHEPLFNSDEEYNKYVKGYKRAINYQKNKYGVVGWYAYNCQTYGVKWDSKLSDCGYCDIDIDNNGYVTLEFYFDTPWNEPLCWFRKMTEMFSTLNFTMRSLEEGMGFNVAHYYDGETKSYDFEDLPLPEYDEDGNLIE